MGVGEGGEKMRRKEGCEGVGETGTTSFRGMGRGGEKICSQEFGQTSEELGVPARRQRS